MHADQINDKDKRLVWLDDASGSGGAIAKRRRNRHPASTTLAHALNTLFPARNHVSRAEGKAEGLIAIPRGIELICIRPRDTDVMHLHGVSGSCLGTFSNDLVFDDQFGRCGRLGNGDRRFRVVAHGKTVGDLPRSAHVDGPSGARAGVVAGRIVEVVATLVDLQRVTTRLSDRVLFEACSLTVSENDRIGVVGINGTGKSTLLRVIAGEVNPDSGSVLRAKNIRIGYLEQDPELTPGTVLNAVGEGWESKAVLERVGLGAYCDRDVSELSGGQAKRVALAHVLAQPFDLLVLDEPTNHLDLAAVDWLERRLAEFRGGLMLVSHDRHLLDRVATKMVELDRGEVFVHTGGYGAYLEAKVRREEIAVTAEASRANLARRELAWLRRGAPARTRKPKAHIDAARELIERKKPASARAGELELSFGTPRLGDQVITVEGIGYRFPGGEREVLHSVSLDLDPRDRLGIVGPNGSGKTTLLDLLARRRQPSTGTIKVGSTVVIGYYDQHGVELEPGARVRDLVAGDRRVPGSPEDNLLMERFWFTKDLPFARVSTLSGGERKRLQLLLVLAQRPNVVFLDEPTNDLDLDTLRVIEDFFDDWPGALVVVSHDRTFLDRSVERLIVVDTDGSVRPVAGGVGAYVDELTRTSLNPQRPGAPSKGRAGRSASLVGSSPLPKRPRSMSTLGRLIHDAEKSIARLTRERDALLVAMSETADYLALAELGVRFDEVQDLLVDAEQSWLELGLEAESSS